ncbi:MAG: hypothetical protein PVG77_04710, partial [Nitrosopumilaceae archaeon]
MSENEEIIKVIETFFEAGKTKDFSHLNEIHLDDNKFSSFSDLPPYDLKDLKTTLELEQLKFISITDYDYQVKSPKISIFGDT